MKPNHFDIQHSNNSQSVSTQARLLITDRRQKLRNRQESMLH